MTQQSEYTALLFLRVSFSIVNTPGPATKVQGTLVEHLQIARGKKMRCKNHK